MTRIHWHSCSILVRSPPRGGSKFRFYASIVAQITPKNAWYSNIDSLLTSRIDSSYIVMSKFDCFAEQYIKGSPVKYRLNDANDVTWIYQIYWMISISSIARHSLTYCGEINWKWHFLRARPDQSEYFATTRCLFYCLLAKDLISRQHVDFEPSFPSKDIKMLSKYV